LCRHLYVEPQWLGIVQNMNNTEIFLFSQQIHCRGTRGLCLLWSLRAAIEHNEAQWGTMRHIHPQCCVSGLFAWSDEGWRDSSKPPTPLSCDNGMVLEIDCQFNNMVPPPNHPHYTALPPPPTAISTEYCQYYKWNWDVLIWIDTERKGWILTVSPYVIFLPYGQHVITYY
jgi:hypothetical protein